MRWADMTNLNMRLGKKSRIAPLLSLLSLFLAFEEGMFVCCLLDRCAFKYDNCLRSRLQLTPSQDVCRHLPCNAEKHSWRAFFANQLLIAAAFSFTTDTEQKRGYIFYYLSIHFPCSLQLDLLPHGASSWSALDTFRRRMTPAGCKYFRPHLLAITSPLQSSEWRLLVGENGSYLPGTDECSISRVKAVEPVVGIEKALTTKYYMSSDAGILWYASSVY
ncbi:hypothetical protein J3F83DRAFT_669177 [Trichoderma novae-zelandiae]